MGLTRSWSWFVLVVSMPQLLLGVLRDSDHVDHLGPLGHRVPTLIGTTLSEGECVRAVSVPTERVVLSSGGLPSSTKDRWACLATFQVFHRKGGVWVQKHKKELRHNGQTINRCGHVLSSVVAVHGAGRANSTFAVIEGGSDNTLQGDDFRFFDAAYTVALSEANLEVTQLPVLQGRPGGISDSALAYDNDFVYAYGGYTKNRTVLSGLYRLPRSCDMTMYSDVADCLRWQRLDRSGASHRAPPPSWQGAIAVDTSRHRIYQHGGCIQSMPAGHRLCRPPSSGKDPSHGELWMLDISSRTWEMVWGGHDEREGPVPRFGHAIVVNSGMKILSVLGGASRNGEGPNDGAIFPADKQHHTWRFDVEQRKWTEVHNIRGQSLHCNHLVVGAESRFPLKGFAVVDMGSIELPFVTCDKDSRPYQSGRYLVFGGERKDNEFQSGVSARRFYDSVPMWTVDDFGGSAPLPEILHSGALTSQNGALIVGGGSVRSESTFSSGMLISSGMLSIAVDAQIVQHSTTLFPAGLTAGLTEGHGQPFSMTHFPNDNGRIIVVFGEPRQPGQIFFFDTLTGEFSPTPFKLNHLSAGIICYSLVSWVDDHSASLLVFADRVVFLVDLNAPPAVLNYTSMIRSASEGNIPDRFDFVCMERFWDYGWIGVRNKEIWEFSTETKSFREVILQDGWWNNDEFQVQYCVRGGDWLVLGNHIDNTLLLYNVYSDQMVRTRESLWWPGGTPRLYSAVATCGDNGTEVCYIGGELPQRSNGLQSPIDSSIVKFKPRCNPGSISRTLDRQSSTRLGSPRSPMYMKQSAYFPSRCDECEVGSYQGLGVDECIKCPDGLTTPHSASLHLDDCSIVVRNHCNGGIPSVVANQVMCTCTIFYTGNRCQSASWVLMGVVGLCGVGIIGCVASICAGALYRRLTKRTLRTIGEVKAKTRVTVKKEMLGQYEVDPRTVNITNVLGAGASGVVYLGEWHRHAVAVKELVDVTRSVNDFVMEAEHMIQLHHPNVIRCEGYALDPPYLILEYAMHGSLGHLIHNTTSVSLGDKRRFCTDIARGLEYLHSRTPAIIHRDLKPDNVVIGAGHVAKITDFGAARLNTDCTNKTMRIGTPVYSAPELLDKQGSGSSYDVAVDIFSYGCLVYELYTGLKPYAHIRWTTEVVKMIQNRVRPEFPAELSCTKLARMVSRCWEHDPLARPTAAELVEFFLDGDSISFTTNVANDDIASMSVSEAVEPTMLSPLLPA